ncbi:SMP-30/gluconolactonase/LRE family protein [bacterium LRH843]|nr:SMP-30/gluconolactonase/LRE family protein [bacterium LRH843]
MKVKAELVIDAKATLGEGPCWDSEKHLLYWVDIIEKKVHIHNPKTKSNQSIDVAHLPGAAVVRDSGGLVLATQNGFYTLDEKTKELTLIEDPESDRPHNRFNDGKCDPAGRFWAGTMEVVEKEPTGSLYVLDTDLTVKKVLSDITISNGLAWSSDNKTMYYIDSPTKQVAAFDYDLESGQLSNKRIVVTIPEGEGIPDGMTIDAEDMLWVAQWGGYKVSKWNPQTGEKIGEVSVPAKQVTSCVFAGEQLDELYITSARRGLDEEELETYPQSGGVFRVKTDVKGGKTFSFKG